MLRLIESSLEFSALSAKQIAEAKKKLVRCLEAYDREGEAGLEREIQRIYPAPEGDVLLAGMKPLAGVTFFDREGRILDPETLESISDTDLSPTQSEARRQMRVAMGTWLSNMGNARANC